MTNNGRPKRSRVDPLRGFEVKPVRQQTDITGMHYARDLIRYAEREANRYAEARIPTAGCRLRSSCSCRACQPREGMFLSLPQSEQAVTVYLPEEAFG